MVTFRKKIVSKNNFYDYINTVVYDIFIDDSLISTLEIKNTFAATLHYKGVEYKIKPIVKIFTISKYEILINQDIKIGEIRFSGWTWVKSKIIITSGANQQLWVFNKNFPSFFKSRKDTFQTFLVSNRESISYSISLGSFFEKTKNNRLREISGIINNFEINPIVGLVGIFLNEILIFDETDK